MPDSIAPARNRRFGSPLNLCTLLAAAGLVSCGGDTTTSVTPPGAPTLLSAIAGDSNASLGFSAPSSSGGAAITGYTATCAAGGISRSATGSASPLTVANLANDTTFSCSVVATNSAGAGAASAFANVTPVAGGVGGGNGTASVLCGLTGNEFNADESVNLTATFSWACNGSARVLTANGVPNHEVGTFPGPGNPHTIAAVGTSATYTLNPIVGASNTTVATTGYALNGVKLEPGTAGTCDDAGGNSCTLAMGSGPWNIEALGQTAFDFGTDSSNGHVQPTGAYHYHGMPESFIVKLGKGTATMTLVAWATDGFPIYARYGHSTANDPATPLKVLRGSYALKSAPDANRPSTATYAMGTFTQDYRYVAGSGDLDECNGRVGVTPEFPTGIYHYVITDSYPFINRCVKGTAAPVR